MAIQRRMTYIIADTVFAEFFIMRLGDVRKAIPTLLIIDHVVTKNHRAGSIALDLPCNDLIQHTWRWKHNGVNTVNLFAIAQHQTVPCSLAKGWISILLKNRVVTR